MRWGWSDIVPLPPAGSSSAPAPWGHTGLGNQGGCTLQVWMQPLSWCHLVLWPCTQYCAPQLWFFITGILSCDCLHEIHCLIEIQQLLSIFTLVRCYLINPLSCFLLLSLCKQGLCRGHRGCRSLHAPCQLHAMLSLGCCQT